MLKLSHPRLFLGDLDTLDEIAAMHGQDTFLDGNQQIKEQPDHKVIGLRPRFFRGLL